MESTSTATIVTLDEGKAIKPFGLDMKVLLSAEATEGKISVILAAHQPGEGPPDHLHHSQEECFYVIEGTYEMTAGNESRMVGAGTIVYLPRGVVHRFKNVGTTVARMLDWSLPGGQDRYFTAISELAAGGGFSGDRVKQISSEHDTHFPAQH